MAKQVANDLTQYKSTHRYARISARKVRLVVDMIRGKSVGMALQDLRFCLKRGAPMVSKVLNSAIANATQMEGLESSSLFISEALVNEGPTLKRWRPRAMGRAMPRLGRTCHIQIAVAHSTESETEAPRGVSRKDRAPEKSDGQSTDKSAASTKTKPAKESEAKKSKKKSSTVTKAVSTKAVSTKAVSTKAVSTKAVPIKKKAAKSATKKTEVTPESSGEDSKDTEN